jgi:benzoate membrane transport protein
MVAPSIKAMDSTSIHRICSGQVVTSLATALKEEGHRDAAVITFLVTLSGVSLAGIGSAFWGVLAGTMALLVQQSRTRTPS